MIPKEKIEKLKQGIKLTDVIPDLTRSGQSYCTKCPNCEKEGKGKGLSIYPKKNTAKCFSCDYTISDAVGYLIKVEKRTFVEAVEEIARRFNYDIEPEHKKAKRLNGEKVSRQVSVCDRQLESSGLTADDVRVSIFEDSREIQRPASRKGTRDQYNLILVGEGDDMLIYYYDLHGKPVQYKQEKTGRFLDLVRVRWSNPELHKDKAGRPIKYQ